VKGCLVLAVLLCGIRFATAQDQEQKLIDRLLKPNTELQNTQYEKKFLADKTSVNKQATVSTFYWQQKAAPKSFNGTRDFSTRDFDSHPFYRSGQTFDTKPSETGRRTATVSTARAPRSFYDGGKTANSRAFSGTRQFLDKGKSQKSLDRTNPPMTIDQVRELLNKNK
jgi:hypothetical protein